MLEYVILIVVAVIAVVIVAKICDFFGDNK
jgi:hypothetical protein